MSSFISCQMSWTLSEHSSRCCRLHKRCFPQIKAAPLRLFQGVITLNGLSEHTSNNHRYIHLWSRLYSRCSLPANQLAPRVTNPPDRFSLELAWFCSVRAQQHHPASQNSLWWGGLFLSTLCSELSKCLVLGGGEGRRLGIRKRGWDKV